MLTDLRLHRLLHLSERFVLCGPLSIVSRLFQQVDVFLCHLPLAIEQRATQQEFQMIHAPACLHAVFQAPAVAVVGQSVVQVDVLAAQLSHAQLEVGVGLLCPVGIGIHLVAGTSQLEECQILIYHNHTSGLALMLAHNLQHAFPVALIYAGIHAYLLVEGLVLIPPVPAAPHPYSSHHQWQQGRHPVFHVHLDPIKQG